MGTRFPEDTKGLGEWRAGERRDRTNQNTTLRDSWHFRIKLLNSTAREAQAKLGPSCLAQSAKCPVLETLRRWKVSPFGRARRGARV